jgi:hypothetical protein
MSQEELTGIYQEKLTAGEDPSKLKWEDLKKMKYCLKARKHH